MKSSGEKALVLVAAALVERDRGERDREHLAGAALGARTLDEARRALWEWLDLLRWHSNKGRGEREGSVFYLLLGNAP